MARPTVKKKVATSNKKSSSTRNVETLAEQYISVRYNDYREPKHDFFKQGFLSLLSQNAAADAEYLALLVPRRWQVLSITYCADNFGKEYRLIGYGRTTASFRGWDEGIKPLLRKLLQDVESNMNANHLVGRANIITPIGNHSFTMSRIVHSQRKSLRLREYEIPEIQAMIEGPIDHTFAYESFNDLELDDKIQVLLRGEV